MKSEIPKSCKVTLLDMTSDYARLLNKVWEVSKANKTLDEIDAMDLNQVDIPGIANLDLPVSEFINFVWCIENMPRSFWDQLDRYRCLVGSTKIKLLDGSDVEISDLVDRDEFYVYSSDDNNNVVPGRGHSARISGYITSLCTVTLDNDETIQCTPDHKFLMKDGTYKEAQHLDIKDSSMPLYGCLFTNGYKTGYPGVINNLDGKKKLIHKVVSVTIAPCTKIPVYDITVDKYHNFALSSGIFVHNSAGYWEQGLRILDIRNFASSERYFTPPHIKNNPELNKIYVKTMKLIEEEYNLLLNNGAAVEDARGIIPLHILTRGTFVINLRNFRKLISTRLCHVCQGTYWTPVISGMISELKKVLPDTIVSSISKLPCSGKSACPIETNAIVTLEKGAKNLLCPVYLRKYLPEDQREQARKVMTERDPDYDKMCDDYIETFNIDLDTNN